MASETKKIYTIANAHLDTVWNWDFEHTITKCLYNTLVRNFALFEKYPDYQFNFEGAYRYELIAEYYPELFEKLKGYVAGGRWNPCGSSYENGDVNIPSPEALFRNILYGNNYFEKNFGKTSKDIFLPDCFGFGWALPSVAAHAGLLGFTTQKLTWGSAYGTPFDIGRWYGVDGKFVFAALKPGAYDKPFRQIRASKFLQQKLKENEKYNLPLTCAFHGVGDQGGAPKEKSVHVLTQEMEENSGSNVQVLSAPADQIYRDLATGNYSDLPAWRTELVMKNHGAGGYTSRAVGKRWNRQGEELADRTERAALMAHHFGTAAWPKQQLDACWKRIIAHQFHDDLPGTSVQRAYQRSWNDYYLSVRQLTEEYEAAVGACAGLIDTSFAKGVPVLVHNSLEYSRRALVTMDVPLGACRAVQVLSADGESLQCQINYINLKKKLVNLSFTAELPALGICAFDVRPLEAPTQSGHLKITQQSLENQRYKVTLNDNGDVAGIFDKDLGRELLSAPVTYDLFDYKGSKDWPAWELNFNELNRESSIHPVKKSVRILERGNARVALQVVQEARGSVFTTIISLSDGGQSVQFDTEIMWHSLQTAVKNRFSFTASNPEAAFDLGLGAIRRGNMNEKLFEVPAQKWADITDKSGAFGVSVLSECKYGWDKWSDNTLRLTAVHTPQRNYRKDSMQSFLDLGLNRYSFAIHGHEGEQLDTVNRQARELTQPAAGFVTDCHKGVLGPAYSFGSLNNPSVALRALKLAEKDGGTVIVRVNETGNQAHKEVCLSIGGGILSAKEALASEEIIGDAVVKDGKLVFDIAPYEVKTFALKLCKPQAAENVLHQQPLSLPYNIRCATSNQSTGDGILGTKPYSIPKEIFPAVVEACRTRFEMGSVKKGCKNAVLGRGQMLPIPDGFQTLSILAGSLNGDRNYTFTVGQTKRQIKLHEVDERLGVWDLYELGETAHIREAPLAYTFTHTHSGGKDQVAHQIYFFRYNIPLNGAQEVTLPDDPNFCLLAATAVEEGPLCTLATRLSDKAKRRKMNFSLTRKEKIRYRFWKTFAEWHK